MLMKVREFILIIFVLIFWQESLWSQTSNQEIVVSPGSTVILTANAMDGVSYQWFYNNIMIKDAITVQYPAKLPGIYTVVAFNTQGCPSPMSLEVKIIFTTIQPPTYGNLQVFCDNPIPTIADLSIQGQNIKWYDPVLKTPLSNTTPLKNNSQYYATQTIKGVESAAGILVLVQIISIHPPTTNYKTQQFCSRSNPVVSDIQINEPDIKWYDKETGGTIISNNTPLKDRTVYYAAKTETEVINCESTTRLAVTVIVNDELTPIMVSGKNTVCINEEAVYTTAEGMSDYSWLVEGGQIIEGGKQNDSFVKILWNHKGQGTVNVSYTDNEMCDKNGIGILDITINVCSDLVISKTVNNSIPFIGDIITFTITLENKGSDVFKDIVVSESLPRGLVFVNSKVSNGVYDNISGLWNIPVLAENQTVILTLKTKVLDDKVDESKNYLNTVNIESSNPLDINLMNNHSEILVKPECIIVYNGFSPNGDNLNNFFRIDCIENYPNNKIEVYNRYGSLVYSKKGYQNDWDGVANVNNVTDKGKTLPDGTYYYILDLGDGSNAKVGWLYLQR